MLTQDDDDFLGDIPATQPPERRVGANGGILGRPTREERRARLAAEAAQFKDNKIDLPDVGMFYRPVGVKFLADVFRMEQRTVLKKLMKCPVVEYGERAGKKVPKWDFKVAASYLVDPKIDIEAWIKSQRVQDLPHHINDQFWKAQLSKQRWEANAKHTWRDEDVLRVLGEAAMLIRDTSLLWIENLPDKATISNENYHALRGEVTDLLEQIKKSLVDMPKQRRTESTLQLALAEAQEHDDEALGDFEDEVD